jgi:L-seryl-tRNA(Ser) seleniumtransferase
VDKITLAALEATLKIYLEGKATEQVPTLKMLTLSPEALEKRSRTLVRRIRKLKLNNGLLEVLSQTDYSQAGGGALPLDQLPTVVLTLRSSKVSAETLERLFRSNDPPILGRRHKDLFSLDLRTIQEGLEEHEVVQAIKKIAEIVRHDINGMNCGGRQL